MNKFIKFLKDNSILEKFLTNGVMNEEELEKWLKMLFYYDGNLRSAVSAAFSWTRTPEGSDFWIDVHNKWNKECNKKARVQVILEVEDGG